MQAIGQDGRITAAGGPYAGLDVETAAERILADLEMAGALVRIEDYAHSVATCDRCSTPVEPLISEQWFMHMDELKEPAIEAVRDGSVRFTPERWGHVYLDWMENLRPWCISRQLWWGHQLPVWYCDDCGEIVVAETEPPACTRCAGTKLTRETDVLDTWFSSALWPFATWGWPERLGGSGVLLSHQPAEYGARDRLSLGRAHGHDGSRVRRRRPFPRRLHPLRDPGYRRPPDEQESGHGHRPSRV